MTNHKYLENKSDYLQNILEWQKKKYKLVAYFVFRHTKYRMPDFFLKLKILPLQNIFIKAVIYIDLSLLNYCKAFFKYRSVGVLTIISNKYFQAVL